MKIIDLSLPLYDGTPSPPSQARKVEVKTVHKSPGFWQASWLSFSAHTASHVDSQLHVVKDTPAIGNLPLDNFIGDAVILDLTHKDAKEAITVDDLKKFEEDIKEGDIVILRTDWTDKKFGTDDYWNESPYLTVEGAEWLAGKKPKAIAFDFFEEYSARLVDFKPDDFVMHKAILGKGIFIMEGFTNLGKIGRKRFKLFAAPLKIIDAEAAPARFFAVVE